MRRPNETTEMWRDIHRDASERRDAIEHVQEVALARAVAAQQLDARELGPTHWRVWHPAAPDAVLDFWPRTRKARDPYRSEPAFHATVAVLILLLTPSEGGTSRA